MKKRITPITHLKRISTLFVMCLFVASSLQPTAYAVSAEQFSLFQKGIIAYDVDIDCGTSTQTGSSSVLTSAEYNAMPGRELTVNGSPDIQTSIYGGTWDGGRNGWVSTNSLQGVTPGHGLDDNGNSATGPQAGKANFAELAPANGAIGTVLGNLPMRTKVAVDYNGRVMILQKGDVGTGNGSGNKGIDFWWEAAAGLNYRNGSGVVRAKVLDNQDTPLSQVPASQNMGGWVKIDAGTVGEPTPGTTTGTPPPAVTVQQASAAAAGAGATAGNFTSPDPDQRLRAIFAYLTSKGLTKTQAAATVGNIAQESQGDPTLIEGGAHSNDPAAAGGRGWGLIQWTPGSRVTGYAKDAGANGEIHLSPTQLDIVLWHMRATSPTGRTNMLGGFTQTTVEDATKYFMDQIEAPGVPQLEKRIAAAKIAFEQYSAGDGATQVSASTGCVCATNNTGAISSGAILLDPGHSGRDMQGKETDPETQIYIGDSSNSPERENVFQVAQKVKADLEAAGYKVEMTKNSPDDYVNLKQRAEKANSMNAALAVSIHTTPGQFGSAATDWVTEQKVDGYRTGQNGQRTRFTDAEVARKSLDAAQKMVEARKKNGMPGTVLHDLNFDNRPGLSPGNLSTVQLFSKVPWIYNEAGESGLNMDAYAKGIAEGIKAAVQPGGGGQQATTPGQPTPDQPNTDTPLGDRIGNAAGDAASIGVDRSLIASDPAAQAPTGPVAGTTAASGLPNCGSGTGTPQGFIDTLKAYAWPDYHAPNFFDMMPAYKEAITRAQQGGKYVGGGPHPGIDCGGFVTRLMQDSGLDPEYGGGGYTVVQENYMRSHPDKYELITNPTAGTLQAGDIAINASHTYIFVGQIPGFNSQVASASYSPSNRNWRTPMAGREAPADGAYRWFRPKAAANATAAAATAAGAAPQDIRAGGGPTL